MKCVILYSRLIPLFIALFGFCPICDASATDMVSATGFVIESSQWIRAMAAEEQELDGWVFYNCSPGRYEDTEK